MTINTNMIIFVVGNSRSGTTMMGSILGNDRSVFTFRELHFFEQLWSSKNKDMAISWDESVKLAARLLSIQRCRYLIQGNPREFYEEAKKIVKNNKAGTMTSAEVFHAFLSYEALKNGKNIPCDQTPQNVFYIAEILEIFPHSRIINMIRDPRDVLLSQKMKWRRRFLGAKRMPLFEVLRSWVNYHPITITKLWNAAVDSANRYNDEPRVYTLCFEKLLTNPVAGIRDVCDFLGITYRDNLLDIPQIGSSHRADQLERKGINQEATGKWQKGGLTSSELFFCQWMAKTNMDLYGYNAALIRPNPLLILAHIISFPIKLVLAFLFSLNRMKSIVETIRKRLS